MNNKTVTTHASRIASIWFSEYLKEKLKTHPAHEIAQAIGMDKKAIYAYISMERSPKLDIVANVLAYFHETEITIPLMAREEGKA